MKYIKTLEQITYTPEREDYVIMNTKYNDKELKTFINSNIGQITNVFDNTIVIAYENVPDRIIDYFYLNSNEKHTIQLGIQGILYHSINKETLEIYLAQNKYNL